MNDREKERGREINIVVCVCVNDTIATGEKEECHDSWQEDSKRKINKNKLIKMSSIFLIDLNRDKQVLTKVYVCVCGVGGQGDGSHIQTRPVI